jgi:thioredoxin 1
MVKTVAGAALAIAASGALWLAAALGPQSGSFSSEIRRNIYPAPAAAEQDIHHALAEAAREHKNVLLEFGGDWCGDCLVLNYYMHQPPNDQLVEQDYVVVDINVGHLDENLDLGAKYGVPIKKGVPLLAILDPHGRILYSQRQGGFDIAFRNQPSVLTALLNQWKPSK